jgi:hypothetical protein
MFLKRCSLAALLSVALIERGDAAIIAEYDLVGLTTTAPATVSATTADPGVTPALLSRGTGIDAAGLTRGFSAQNFNLTGASVNDAIAQNEYFEWGFTVNPGSIASLTTMDFSLRRSATNGPSNFEVRSSLDNFATPGTTLATFQYLGRSSGTAPGVVVPFQWMTTDTPGQGDGNLITPIVLSTQPSLQAIPGGTSVTFRLYVWGNLAGAAVTNTVALGRQSATNGPGGPSIEGTVVTIPEPTSFALIGFAMTAGLVALRRS